MIHFQGKRGLSLNIELVHRKLKSSNLSNLSSLRSKTKIEDKISLVSGLSLLVSKFSPTQKLPFPAAPESRQFLMVLEP